jgi:protein SCO1/2
MSWILRAKEFVLPLLAVAAGLSVSSVVGTITLSSFGSAEPAEIDPAAADSDAMASAAALAERTERLSAEVLPAFEGPRQTELLPEVPLVDHSGVSHLFRSELATGKVLCMAMFYTRCKGTCPGTVSKMLRLRRTLTEEFGRENVRLLCLTLDPEYDSPEVLQRYTATMGIDNNSELAPIYFCTGHPKDVEAVRRSTGMYDPDPVIDADISLHAAKVLIGNDVYNRWTTMPAGLPFEDLRETALRIAGVSDRQRYSTRLSTDIPLSLGASRRD